MPLLAFTSAVLQKYVSFGPTVVRRLHGTNNQSSDVWIQLHQKQPDTIAAPLASGNVPVIKSLYALANSPFVFSFGDPGIFCNPLIIGMSTTEASFTSVAASGGLDMTLEYDTLYGTNANETITGDTSTGVDAINPWTDSVANAGKRLLQVVYTNNDGADRYLLCSTDAGVSNLPAFIYKVATGVTLTLDGGLNFPQLISEDSAFAFHYGCRLLQSTTASVAGLTSSAASYIKALWR